MGKLHLNTQMKLSSFVQVYRADYKVDLPTRTAQAKYQTPVGLVARTPE